MYHVKKGALKGFVIYGCNGVVLREGEGEGESKGTLLCIGL